MNRRRRRLDQSTVTDDYLTTISGTYVELFPELSKSEYRNIWIDATTPLVGAENAEATTDMLLGMCMAEPYGPEATEKYAADPDSMAFNCYFLGGVDKFVMDGHTITGLDAQGQEVFSTPTSCWMRKTKTASSSIRARMKIPASLPILPFHPIRWKRPIIWSSAMQRISSDLQSWFEGNYAYWNAAAIAENYDQATMENVIELFATENLSEAE